MDSTYHAGPDTTRGSLGIGRFPTHALALEVLLNTMVRPEVEFLFERRITVLVGHFGSGKTEVAVNGALGLARQGDAVALVDLDVVKPYFRSRSAREWVEKEGVTLVAPTGENAYADLPIVVPQVRSLFREEGRKVIMDVGGDDSGSRVLGSLADVFGGTDTDLFLVLNFRRPFTETVDGAVAMAEDIGTAARQRLTGIVSNTHLLGETTPAIVEEGLHLARETARRLEVPVRAVTVDEELVPRLGDLETGCPVVPLRRIIRPPFEGSKETRNTGPLFVLN